MANGFCITVASESVGRSLVERFAPEPVEGPMQTPRAQMVADAVTALAVLDPTIKIDYQPITPIDPISMKPDFDQTDRQMVITTELGDEEVFEAFMTSEAAMLEAAEGIYA